MEVARITAWATKPSWSSLSSLLFIFLAGAEKEFFGEQRIGGSLVQKHGTFWDLLKDEEPQI